MGVVPSSLPLLPPTVVRGTPPCQNFAGAATCDYCGRPGLAGQGCAGCGAPLRGVPGMNPAIVAGVPMYAEEYVPRPPYPGAMEIRR